MLGPEEKEAIEKGFLLNLIIWGAMLASLFVYVLICHVAGDQIQQTHDPEFPIALIRNILMGIAAATLFLTYYMRRVMLRVRSNGPDSLLKFDHPTALSRYTSTVIISLALCESIGLYGLVLFLLGDDFQTLYIFIGVAAIAMYFFRPIKEELVELTLAMHGGEMQPPHTLH